MESAGSMGGSAFPWLSKWCLKCWSLGVFVHLASRLATSSNKEKALTPEGRTPTLAHCTLDH